MPVNHCVSDTIQQHVVKPTRKPNRDQIKTHPIRFPRETLIVISLSISFSIQCNIYDALVRLVHHLCYINSFG